MIMLYIAGCIWGAFLQHYHHEQWNAQALFYNSYTLNIRGTITDLEHLNVDNKERITLYTQETQNGPRDDWQKSGNYLTAYITSQEALQVGDVIEIQEASCAQLTDQNRKLFRRRGIVAQVYRTRKIQILSRPTISFKRLLYIFKNYTAHQLKEKLSPQTHNLFSTIFLGKRTLDNNDNIDDYFGYWGLNHYLARAGLHLAFLFLMLNLFTSLFMLPASKKACANLGICIGYYCLTWTNIPFMRALTVIVGQQICTILSIPINSIHLLNLAFLLYILSNPGGIFYLDVQLTFAITYAILLAVRYRAHTTIKPLCKK
jgi:predicted membrane metal-binding protein